MYQVIIIIIYISLYLYLTSVYIRHNYRFNSSITAIHDYQYFLTPRYRWHITLYTFDILTMIY